MLTAKQRELLIFIDDRLKDQGISPSFDEMREALDLKSKSGVHRLISALEERGFIRRLPNRARALEVLKLPEARPMPVAGASVTALRPVTPAPANDTLEIPLHGRIAAGTPIEALQGTENFSVPAALLGNGEHYALEVSGDSMVDEGILDGDFALIRKVDTAHDGEIVVALIDDEEATLKTFRREGSMIRLDPANRNYEPQRYEPRRVRIQGAAGRLDPAVLSVARIDYVELPSATAHELTRAFYARAFGWSFTDYGPTYSATTNGVTDAGLQGDPTEALSAVLPVIRVDDLDGAFKRVSDAGGVIARAIFAFPGGRRFHFIDPSGNELAVWSAD